VRTIEDAKSSQKKKFEKFICERVRLTAIFPLSLTKNNQTMCLKPRQYGFEEQYHHIKYQEKILCKWLEQLFTLVDSNTDLWTEQAYLNFCDFAKNTHTHFIKDPDHPKIKKLIDGIKRGDTGEWRMGEIGAGRGETVTKKMLSFRSNHLARVSADIERLFPLFESIKDMVQSLLKFQKTCAPSLFHLKIHNVLPHPDYKYDFIIKNIHTGTYYNNGLKCVKFKDGVFYQGGGW